MKFAAKGPRVVAGATKDIGKPEERFWFKLVSPEEGDRMAREFAQQS